MKLRRPLLWMAGVLVLGELCGIYELSFAVRTAAFMLFILIIWLITRGLRRENGSRRWIPYVLILCFAAGVLRGLFCCRAFQTPESRAFFSRYLIRNQGEFDYGLYLKGLGISSEAALSDYRNGGLLNSDLPYFSQLGKFRLRCTEVLSGIFPEKDAGIYQALLLGDKSDMDEGVRALYQSQGIAHLLAVSGLHFGIIGMGLYRMLRLLTLSPGCAGAFSSLFVVSYGFLTGAQGSAVRAVIMLLSRFLSLKAGRSYDTLSALALSAFLLLLAKPYMLFQSGFQLSYGAILAISLLGENLIRCTELDRENRSRDRLRKRSVTAGYTVHESPIRRVSAKNRLHPAVKTLVVSLSLQLFMLPAILYHFFVFPLYGFFLNFIVIPLMSFVIASGLMALSAGLLGMLFAAASGCLAAGVPFFQFLSVCAGGAGHYILLFYEWLCRITESLPASGIVLGRPELLRILLFYLGLLLLFALHFLQGFPGSRRFFRIGPPVKLCSFFGLAVCLSVLCFTGNGKLKSGVLAVTAIDVGQGDGFLIRSGKKNILIDCGSSSEKELGKYTLKPFLLSQGISLIDAAFVSHSDADHMNGLLYLMEDVPEVKIAQLILPEGGAVQESYGTLKEAFCISQGEEAKSRISYLREGAYTELPGIRKENGAAGTEIPVLSCIYAGRGALPEANAHSPVLLLSYGNFSMIFTGDTTKGDEALLAKRIRQDMKDGKDMRLPERITVYKAAHHGSKTSNSDAVLKLYRPQYALISYGRKNSYGHPHKEVTKRLTRYGAKLLETGKSGQISLITDGKNLMLRHMVSPDGDYTGNFTGDMID
ncbi:MAG: DNA internalization-related competence protein ComEC/Rec2 [Eubacteriales bacterium]|nr:DNA internalization-related competence protein ComEC/Rec2 [Eubacteriales bacterium]